MSALITGSNSPQEFKTCAVHCLCAPHDAQAAEQARACFANPAFDWAGFLEYIRRERVSPLIHAAVGGWDVLPFAVAERMRKDYLHSIWINDRRLADLRLVLGRLSATGIPVTLLKGAALICTLYEKRGLRPMTDIDLLVPAPEMQRAAQVFLSCGYQYRHLPTMPADFTVEVGFQISGRDDSFVDLHTSLYNPPHQLTAQQLDWFYQRRICSTYEGLEVWTFAPTAQMLHLCAHLWLHHSDEGDHLLRLHDIDLLIRSRADQIDWVALLSAAHAFDLLLPMQKNLPALAALWNTSVPASVLACLARLVPSTRERRKFGKHWGDQHNYLKTLLGGTFSHPTWRARLRYVRLIIFPPWRYIAERYHVRSPLLVPYFYAHRLVSRAIQQVGRLL